MKGMPLLLAATHPMLGPLVPVFGLSKRIRSEGLAQGDRVLVFGGDEKTIVADFEGPGDVDIAVDLTGHRYVRAQRFGSSIKGIHIWLEG